MNDREQTNIDEICRRYENECGDGSIAQILVYLSSSAQRSRPSLLRKLIASSIELRIKAGQIVAPEDYTVLGDDAVGAAYLVNTGHGADRTLVGDATDIEIHQPDRIELTIDAACEPTPFADISIEGDDKENDLEVLKPGTTIGKYKLQHMIGEGGMGTVWMAQQERPVQRQVALKVIRSDLGSRRAITRFEAERQALAMMEHPNIARVFDAGTTIHGSPYFVMELVDGMPITKYCDNNNLNIKQRLSLLIPVCKAVQHAHQKGIIHRDLKPSNVLVAEFDGQPQPKVIDFGLAKALDQKQTVIDKPDLTKLGQVVGTLRYMSPEQAGLDEADVDTRTDVYSMGVIMYELMTGSTPLEKSSMERAAMLQVLNQIKEMEPPRPSIRLSDSHNISEISKLRNVEPAKLRRMLRGDLDWIVMKALDRERDRRYQSVSGMADDLKRFVDGDEVLARPPTTIYRLQKFVARNRGLVASALVIAALLLGGIISTSWFAIDANRAKQAFAEKAESEREQRLLADQNSREALANENLAVANEQLAIEAEKIADDQRILAVAAQKKLARQLQLAEVRQYASKLQQSLLAHQSGAFNLSNELLDKVKPEFRKWEYDYLKHKMRRMVPYHLSAALMNADQGLFSVNSAFHEGHVYLAAGDVLKINLNTGIAEPILSKTTGDVCALGISSDGKWLTITTLSDCTVYELATMKMQLNIRRDFNWVLDSVAQHFESSDNDIGTQVAFLKVNHLRPNVFEDRFLVLPGKQEIEVLNVFDKSVQSHQLPIAKGFISGYGFDADAGELYVWFEDQLRFVDLRTGKLIRSFAAGSPIHQVATVPGRDYALLAIKERIVKAARQDGEIMGEIPLAGIVDIHWSDDDPDVLYLAGDTLGEVLAWDMEKGAPVRDRSIRVVADGFMAFDLSPDGQYCVYSDSSSWVVRKLELEPVPKLTFPGLHFAEKQDEHSFILILRKNEQHAEVHSINLTNQSTELINVIDGDVLSAGFDPVSQILTTIVKRTSGGEKVSLELTEVKNGKSVRQSLAANEKAIVGNGGQLVLDPTSQLNILDAATAELIGTLPSIEVPDQEFDDLNLDQSSDFFAEFEEEFGELEQTPSAFVMDRSANLVFYAWSLTDSENGVRPRNSMLVCYDLVHSVETFRAPAHLGVTHSLKLSSDGTRLLSCGSDGKIKIWDTDSGIELLTVQSEFSFLNGLALDEQAGIVWYAGRDGIGRLDSEPNPSGLLDSGPIRRDSLPGNSNQASNFLLRASPYQALGPLRLRGESVVAAIDKAEEWGGVKVHAPREFFEDTRQVKLWGSSTSFDKFMARLTRRKMWNYFYLSDQEQLVAVVVPEELYPKIGRKNIGRTEAESIEAIRPLLPGDDQGAIPSRPETHQQ